MAGGGGGHKILEVKILDLIKNLDFQQLSYFQHFKLAVKNFQNVLKGSLVISADILQFFSLLYTD